MNEDTSLLDLLFSDVMGEALSRDDAALYYQKRMLEVEGMGSGYACGKCGGVIEYSFQHGVDEQKYYDAVRAVCRTCKIMTRPHTFDAYIPSPVLLAQTAVQDAADELMRKTGGGI